VVKNDFRRYTHSMDDYSQKQRIRERDRLIEKARELKKTGKDEEYIALLQILEREDIIPNLKERFAAVLGEEVCRRLFDGLPLPPVGDPPAEAVTFTEELVNRLLALEERADGPNRETLIHSLSGNAHGIPAAAFDREKVYFDNAPTLEAYLQGCHSRAVETLREHARTGEIWFEQIITNEVVEFVASRQEVLGGVLRDRRIYLTKIPYDPAGWLAEEDPRKKRYLACHCPMAREALKSGDNSINPLWCACSAGFARQKFNVLFGEETKVEVVSSLLDGDDACRFAITAPERFL